MLVRPFALRFRALLESGWDSFNNLSASSLIISSAQSQQNKNTNSLEGFQRAEAGVQRRHGHVGFGGFIPSRESQISRSSRPRPMFTPIWRASLSLTMRGSSYPRHITGGWTPQRPLFIQCLILV